MIPNWFTPDLCVGLVILTILFAAVIENYMTHRRVVVLLEEVSMLFGQVKLLVRLVEGHGKLNDGAATRVESTAARVESLAAQTSEVATKLAPKSMNHAAEEHVIAEIRKIPDATAEKIFKGSGGSGEMPPLPKGDQS